ncbi:hypothetical protein MLD55_14150 [Alcanivorax sp. MM125-6]|nr:hypothetical protein [Alcanivorax sp. MM125-6]
MELIACDGEWQQGPDGSAICAGTLQNVPGGGPFGLPPITYADANLLLAAIGGVWVSVFIIRQARRLL